MQATEEPVFITLCDASSPLVQPLYSSLRGNLRTIETYSPQLGVISKIFKVQEFLAADTDIADNTIIVFMDAYDVLCIRYDLDGLTTDFKNTGKDLIIGAETVFCHHSADVLPFFLDNYSGQKAKYLNSGFIVGYKWAYLRMLNYIVDNFVNQYMIDSRYDDQRVISRFMLDNSKMGLLNMDIDSAFKFCYTHTYDNNPLDHSNLAAYFVHVTWLALEIQKRTYDEIRGIFHI